MTGRIIAKAKMTKMQPKKKKSKTAAKIKRAGKKAKKKRKARPSISDAEVRRLGLECESLTEADAELHRLRPRLRKNLSDYMGQFAVMKSAWERGRFLRDLKDLAARDASVSQAAKKLRLPNGRALREILDRDPEAGDIWERTKLNVWLDIRQALIEEAKGGNAAAIRALEDFGDEEKERPGFDPSRISSRQLTELTGRNRKTIHEWHTKFGLARNADKTFDLGVFLAWFEDFCLRKAARGNSEAGPLNPFQQVKTERERLKLLEDRGELVNIGRTLGWQLAQLQNIMNVFEKTADYANLMFGQPREQIVCVLEDLRDSVAARLQHVPEFLKLSDSARGKLIELYSVMTEKTNGGGQ